VVSAAALARVGDAVLVRAGFGLAWRAGSASSAAEAVRIPGLSSLARPVWGGCVWAALVSAAALGRGGEAEEGKEKEEESQRRRETG
jgi:hypothetical protein